MSTVTLFFENESHYQLLPISEWNQMRVGVWVLEDWVAEMGEEDQRGLEVCQTSDENPCLFPAPFVFF